MKTLLLSIRCLDGREIGFETAPLPDDVADQILSATGRPTIDGVMMCSIPAWVAGTPLQPIWSFFSQAWNR